MSSATTSPIETSPHAKHTSTSHQVRGSSLLLVGRVLSMALNFVIQVLIVRYLSKAEYGAFAYALSFVVLGQSLATFGLDRAITRFIPIYHEKGEYDKLYGTLLMVVTTICALGLAVVGLVYSLQGLIARTLITDQQAVALLLILICLAPVQALDDLLAGLFAVFANPRSIFFRKYVLAPGLKLSVVLLLILGQSDIYFLAQGYLAAGVLGVVVYALLLLRMLRKEGLFAHFNRATIVLPARELFAFTIPLLTSDLVYVLMSTSDAMLLGYFHNTAEVAAFRVVQPAATLNQLVLSSFTMLFTPMAARLLARNDHAGINHLYWQTAIWTSVVSFPIFAVTFALAQPLIALLYGPEYAGSATILMLLALGYYFNAALGFNGLTLKVFGKLRYVVVINLLAAVVNICINLLLIPRFGALGAACGTCATLIAHNLLKQAGLRYGTQISLFQWRYARVYASIVLGALGLLLVQQFGLSQLTSGAHDLRFYIGLALGLACAGLVSLAVLGLNRRALNIGQTFPELLKLPLMRRILEEPETAAPVQTVQ